MKAPVTLSAVAAPNVTETPVDRLAAQTNPATTSGSRMCATTAPSRPLACAVVRVPSDAQASAAHARGQGARVATRAPRYAVHADSGMAPARSQAIETPTEDAGVSMNGRCSRTQAPADRTGRYGADASALPSPAPCHPSSQACQSPEASVDIGRSSAPATPWPLAEIRAPSSGRQVATASRALTITARKPGWRRIREMTPTVGPSSDSLPSETGPVSDECTPPTRSSADDADPNATASWIASRAWRKPALGETNSPRRSRRLTWRTPRERQRAAIGRHGVTNDPRSPSSSQAFRGRLTRRRTAAEPRLSRAIHSARRGTAYGEHLASAT